METTNYKFYVSVYPEIKNYKSIRFIKIDCFGKTWMRIIMIHLYKFNYGLVLVTKDDK